MMSGREGKIPNGIGPGQYRMEGPLLSCGLSASIITVQDPSNLTGDSTQQLHILWTHCYTFPHEMLLSYALSCNHAIRDIW